MKKRELIRKGKGPSSSQLPPPKIGAKEEGERSRRHGFRNSPFRKEEERRELGNFVTGFSSLLRECEGKKEEEDPFPLFYPPSSSSPKKKVTNISFVIAPPPPRTYIRTYMAADCGLASNCNDPPGRSSPSPPPGITLDRTKQD